MESSEKKIDLLQEMLVKISARRRHPDGSLPPPMQAALDSAPDLDASKEEEEVPYIPEEFEVEAETLEEAVRKAPRPALEEPFGDKAPLKAVPLELEEEEEEGEVTDRVQVIPPISLKPEEEMKPAEAEGKETTLPWFQERGPAAAAQQAKETDAFPEQKKEAASAPEVIGGSPPIEHARPLSVTGQAPEMPRRTIGRLLGAAFRVGETGDE